MIDKQKEAIRAQGKKSGHDMRSGYFLTTALREITETFPQIAPENIAVAACVYYPIADLNLTIKERLFEVFDSIEHDILQFIDDIGADVSLIARTTGLSETYVEKIFRLLMGYGHINKDGMITELAKNSLAEGKKITCTEVAQKVQMDALTLRLLRIEELIRDEELFERAHTSSKVGLIPCVEGITREEVRRRLAAADLQDLIRYDHHILNANAEQIIDVECVDMRYAKCVLLAFRQDEADAFATSTPIIFGKRSDMRRGKYRANKLWLPIFVPDAEDAKYLGNVGAASDLVALMGEGHLTARKKVDALYKKILDEHVKTCTEEWVLDESTGKKEPQKCDGRKKSCERFKKPLASILDPEIALQTNFLEYENTYIGMSIDITAESLARYHKHLPNWLQDIAKRGSSLLSFDTWYGAVLHVTTSDKRMQELSELFCRSVEERGFRFMADYWRQEFMSTATDETSEQSLYVRMMDSLLPERVQQYAAERNG